MSLGGSISENTVIEVGQGHEPIPSNNAASERVDIRYEHAHADGSVYHAENVEVARAACPVLGKMATEQASLLLEVAALGQQKMKEEAVKQPPTPELSVANEKSKPIIKKSMATFEPTVTKVVEKPVDTSQNNQSVRPTEREPLTVVPHTIVSQSEHEYPLNSETPDTNATENQNIIATTDRPDEAISNSTDIDTIDEKSNILTPVTTQQATSAPTQGKKATEETTASQHRTTVEETRQPTNIKAEQGDLPVPETEYLTTAETTTAFDDPSGTNTVIADITPITAPLKGHTESMPTPAISANLDTDKTIIPEAHGTNYEPTPWANMLTQKPEHVLEEFIGSLEPFISVDMAQNKQSFGTLEPDSATTDKNSEPHVEPLQDGSSTIALAVYERFNELTNEEKNTATVLVKNIVEDLAMLEQLDDHQVIEAVHHSLQQQLTVLFTHIAVQHTHKDIEYFITLLSPSRATQHKHEPEDHINLKHRRKSDIKHGLTRSASGTSSEDMQTELKRRIGSLVFSLLSGRLLILPT